MHQELRSCRSASLEESPAARSHSRFNCSSFADWFLWSAAAILVLTGLGKISNAFGTAQVLTTADPVVGIPFRVLLPLAGGFELIIAALSVWRRFPQRSRLLLVAWVSTMFVIYRVGLWAMDWHHPCGCMGSLAGVLHLNDATADKLMLYLLGYLVMGSYVLSVTSRGKDGRCKPKVFTTRPITVQLVYLTPILLLNSTRALAGLDELNPLGPGRYIIERTSYLPSNSFKTEQEAKAWLENARKHPQEIVPERQFFLLYVHPLGFSVQQLREDKGHLVSNQNLFACVEGQNAWAFEEAANRITIVQNLKDVSGAKHVSGILESANRLHELLCTLGLNLFDLSSIRARGNQLIEGRLRSGNSFRAELHRNSSGLLTNLLCQVEDPPKASQISVSVAFDLTTKALAEVSISKRSEATQIWRPLCKHRVLSASVLPQGFAFETLLRPLTNSQTLTVILDAKSGTPAILDRNGQLHSIQPPHPSARAVTNTRRSLIIAALIFGIGTGAWLLFRSFKNIT